jgi:catechol 2,3-dioxygenase-like lactoylglutathione lyase family enzyme
VKAMPIRYVRDMAAARRFYEALGLEVTFASRQPRTGPVRWVELGGHAGGLALHYAGDAEDAGERPIELSFESDEPLEKVVERLAAAGYPPATAIVDESFGRSFTVHDPDGLLLQVNEHDRDLLR